MIWKCVLNSAAAQKCSGVDPVKIRAREHINVLLTSWSVGSGRVGYAEETMWVRFKRTEKHHSHRDTYV